MWRDRCVLTYGAGEAAGEAQISPIQEMVAAQDDLRAGSGFAIPQAPSAGVVRRERIGRLGGVLRGVMRAKYHARAEGGLVRGASQSFADWAAQHSASAAPRAQRIGVGWTRWLGGFLSFDHRSTNIALHNTVMANSRSASGLPMTNHKL